ncbi:MAG: hypothetical protein O2976_05710 [Actinomycetota bacterium]|nr:hypothetical protein [Actinomycetota bacterium]
MPNPIPRELFINGQPYTLAEVGPDRRQWTVTMVPSQPGDGSQPRPHFLEAHGGFGVSHRHTNPRGEVGATHHDYAQNVDTRFHALTVPSPRITFIDLSTLSPTGGAFVFGGFTRSRLGGNATGGLGGGEFSEGAWAFTEYGGKIYLHGGTHTYVVDPAAGTHVETRIHGTSSRARSGDVFDNTLVVALGSNVDAEGATSPYVDSGSPTAWAAASGVQMSTFRVGGSGRLFSAQDNLVFNVLPGQDPADSTKYLPTVGEVITDQTDPVRSLEEFARGLVAGTARTLRTFDPEAGFVSRAILPSSRLSSSDFDGRGVLNKGSYLLYSTTRSVWLIVPGARPQRVGPDISDFNESPYVGGQPGVPDTAGEWDYWPFYYPDTGHSVIFAVRERGQGEPGIGPFVWVDYLYLASVECRAVKFWGGNDSTNPRLFFGAATTANPERCGYITLGKGGAPDPLESDYVPALTGSLFFPHDGYKPPGVLKDVERIEFPNIENADATNYLVASVSDDKAVTWINLVKAQSGSDQERINSTSFQQVFAPTGDVPSGRELIVRLVFTQASGATKPVKVHGEPILYLSERPAMTRQVQTLIKVARDQIEDAFTVKTTLEALAAAGKVQIQHAPGDTAFYAKIHSVKEVEIEIESPSGRREQEWAVELVWREVATA